MLEYLYSKNVQSIPRVNQYSQTREYRYLSMQMLGPSIFDLVKFCGGKLSIKSTLLLGKSILKVLEELHDNRVIHRDIKPGNMTIGLGKNTNQIHVIDFGLDDFYTDHKHRHVPMGQTEKFLGTLRYASVNA